MEKKFEKVGAFLDAMIFVALLYIFIIFIEEKEAGNDE